MSESNTDFLRRVDKVLEQTAIDSIVFEARLLIWEAKRRGCTAAYFPLYEKIAQYDPQPHYTDVVNALQTIKVYARSQDSNGLFISYWPLVDCGDNIYFQYRWDKVKFRLSFFRVKVSPPVLLVLFLIALFLTLTIATWGVSYSECGVYSDLLVLWRLIKAAIIIGACVILGGLLGGRGS